MKIIEIIDTNHIFGFGQISHDPREYYLDSNGSLLYSFINGEPDAVIKTEGYDINIKVASGFCLQIASDGWRINVSKQLINTASPECCVAAAEERLRLIELQMLAMNRLEAHRKAAKLTRAQLSELSGVHPQLIAKYETGERDIEGASYRNIKKLANALQCKPEDIA